MAMFRTKDTYRDDEPETTTTSYQPKSPTSPTQIAWGAEFRGDLKTTGPIMIEGTISGTLAAEGDIQIGAKGKVEAEIEGKDITVAGTVKGKIFADGRVILLSGSRVEGDIHAQSLKIEDSVFFQGGCVMGEGARKNKAAENLPLPDSVRNLKVA